jgi:hypothetical protein
MKNIKFPIRATKNHEPSQDSDRDGYSEYQVKIK